MKKNVIVCISEGINDGKGTFICELASEVGVDTASLENAKLKGFL